eukprot:g7822.t1
MKARHSTTIVSNHPFKLFVTCNDSVCCFLRVVNGSVNVQVHYSCTLGRQRPLSILEDMCCTTYPMIRTLRAMT